MEIIDNRAVLIRTRSPEKYTIIPRSKVVETLPNGGYTVAVAWGLDEMRVLRNLGVKTAPSPIMRSYPWPGRYRPMQHQRETASFLTLHRRGFCFNEPGTGKTLSALWAADYLMLRGDVRRVLVLCPVSIMHTAWMADISNSVIHRSAIVAHHRKAARRVEMLQGDYEIVITNYDGLEIINKEIINDGRFDLVIVDEANSYKNPYTDRWKALASILRPETYLWMMTGTPASQSPVDAYGLAKLVNPRGVPTLLTGWRDKVMNKVTTYKWVPKSNARDIVHEALQPAIRFTKKECLDLPPVIVETRNVAMSAQQAKYYKILKEQMMVMAAGEVITAANAGVALNKLLQISCGAAYSENNEVIEFDSTPRLQVLQEVIEETDRKVIVFALYLSSIDTITRSLEKHKITHAQIHGGVNASKRAQIIDDFQRNPDPRVLVMQPQATAHGITLTAADTVVFYGPLLSVEQYLQCIARADRKGQDSDKVRVIHIQSSPVEERLFKALAGKVSDHSLLVGMFEAEAAARQALNGA